MGSELNPTQMNELIKAAIEARAQAYAVYSNFKVGAALLTKDGKIFTGCNIENVSFTPTVCAERVAIFKAVSEGVFDFQAIAVVSNDTTLTPPCGVCRQVMSEFVDNNFNIVLATDSGEILNINYGELFPMRFIPQQSIGRQDRSELWNTIQSDNYISEEEIELVRQFMDDIVKFEDQITVLVNDGDLDYEDRETLLHLRTKIYHSAVNTTARDDLLSDDDKQLLKKLAHLLQTQ